MSAEDLEAALTGAQDAGERYDLLDAVRNVNTKRLLDKRKILLNELNELRVVADGNRAYISKLKDDYDASVKDLYSKARSEVSNETSSRMNDKEIRIKDLATLEEKMRNENEILVNTIKQSIVDTCNMTIMVYNSSPWQDFYGETAYSYFKMYLSIAPVAGKTAFPEYKDSLTILEIIDEFANAISREAGDDSGYSLNDVRSYLHICASALVSWNVPGHPHPQGLSNITCNSRILTASAEQTAFTNAGVNYYSINVGNVLRENEIIDGISTLRGSLVYIPMRFPLYDLNAASVVLSFRDASAAKTTHDAIISNAMIMCSKAPSANAENIRLSALRESKLVIAINRILSALDIAALAVRGDDPTANDAITNSVEQAIKAIELRTNKLFELENILKDLSGQLNILRFTPAEVAPAAPAAPAAPEEEG